MNKVTYELTLTPENAPLIDQINRLVLGDSYTAPATAATTAKAKAEPEKAADEEEGMSMADFKVVVKKAKVDHGEEFVKAVLVSAGAKASSTLGQMVSALEATTYPDVAVALESGPTEAADDDGLDDLDEEDEKSEVDFEAVKTAAKAYAKEVGRDEAKAIMTKHGASSLALIEKCTPKQVQAMFKEFTA